MTTTSWSVAAELQAICPHTFLALQHLVQAMVEAKRNRGKRGFFGGNKEQAAMDEFELQLKTTIVALSLDNMISLKDRPQFIRVKLIQAIAGFSKAFPNWQDAYSFAHEYFVESEEVADRRIQVIMQ